MGQGPRVAHHRNARGTVVVDLKINNKVLLMDAVVTDTCTTMLKRLSRKATVHRINRSSDTGILPAK